MYSIVSFLKKVFRFSGFIGYFRFFKFYRFYRFFLCKDRTWYALPLLTDYSIQNYYGLSKLLILLKTNLQ